ncbi:hypothetical protein Bca52824_032987 [Brassica carinata]|uniref:Uncharacterized protein n=1 Tax=Brassica carinata TaxID=52824 RepID=A0A8X7V828_BRACI|nr:hypothetical protein Bca52824_032987 [Brassica carinata]
MSTGVPREEALRSGAETVKETFSTSVEGSPSNAPTMKTTPSKPTVSEESEVHSGEKTPMSGLNLLAEQVEKKGGSDHVDKEPQEENTCLIITIWAKPEAYVLPVEDVTDAQAGQASPTNSENYKTPPEDAPMSELCTPEAGKGKIRLYSTRRGQQIGSPPRYS